MYVAIVNPQVIGPLQRQHIKRAANAIDFARVWIYVEHTPSAHSASRGLSFGTYRRILEFRLDAMAAPFDRSQHVFETEFARPGWLGQHIVNGATSNTATAPIATCAYAPTVEYLYMCVCVHMYTVRMYGWRTAGIRYW